MAIVFLKGIHLTSGICGGALLEHAHFRDSVHSSCTPICTVLGHRTEALLKVSGAHPRSSETSSGVSRSPGADSPVRGGPKVAAHCRGLPHDRAGQPPGGLRSPRGSELLFYFFLETSL